MPDGRLLHTQQAAQMTEGLDSRQKDSSDFFIKKDNVRLVAACIVLFPCFGIIGLLKTCV